MPQRLPGLKSFKKDNAPNTDVVTWRPHLAQVVEKPNPKTNSEFIYLKHQGLEDEEISFWWVSALFSGANC